MLCSVEQAFVGRDEKRTPLKTPALEARETDVLPELHQAFEGAIAQTYGLVDLVFSCQTGLLSESMHNKM